MAKKAQQAIALIMLLFALSFGVSHASVYPSILTGGSCTDSQHWSSYDCTQAFDNNNETAWQTSVNGAQWVKYDLGNGNATTTTAFHVLFGTVGSNRLFSGGTFLIEGSNDDSTWTTLENYTAPNDLYSVFFSNTNTIAYRYFRFTENNASFNDASLEIRAYNVPIQTATTSTATAPGPVENVGFFVLAMFIYGAGIYIAMRIF